MDRSRYQKCSLHPYYESDHWEVQYQMNYEDMFHVLKSNKQKAISLFNHMKSMQPSPYRMVVLIRSEVEGPVMEDFFLET